MATSPTTPTSRRGTRTPQSGARGTARRPFLTTNEGQDYELSTAVASNPRRYEHPPEPPRPGLQGSAHHHGPDGTAHVQVDVGCCKEAGHRVGPGDALCGRERRSRRGRLVQRAGRWFRQSFREDGAVHQHMQGRRDQRRPQNTRPWRMPRPRRTASATSPQVVARTRRPAAPGNLAPLRCAETN